MSVMEADIACRQVQKMVFQTIHNGAKVNSFEPWHTPDRRVRPDDVLYVNDICYAKEYPNSFFDIWYPDEDTSVKRPTIVYFHGGGFLFGDKVMGDPLAQGRDDKNSFFLEIVKQGYNLVSANYALAPEYRYPAQFHQADRLMRFLTESQKEYGLDMDHVILMGSSAGADLVQVYGLLLANPAYAVRMKMEPSIRREQVRAVVIDESALSVKDFLDNKNMVMMTQCWLGTDDLKNSEQVRLLDMKAQFGGDYLPAYLIASNRELWFGQGAAEFAQLLNDAGIRHGYYYRNKSYDDLEHGFMQRFNSNPYAKECFDGMMKFMADSLSGADAGNLFTI